VISCLRCFGDYLVENGLWLQNPLRWITGPKLNNTRKIPKNYHRSDLQKIFEESFHSYYPHFRSLYPAIISLFYSTGIRKSELLNLDIDCWNSEEATIKVFASKTRRERVIPVPEVTRKCIESYLIKRNNLIVLKKKNISALFVNKNCERVNGTQLLVQFKRIAKRAGVDKATIHMFRHSCATGLIEEGVPLPHVQRILGHASTISTFRYLEIASPERKKAMHKHPVNEILKGLKEIEYERA
jgi:site-specific recombinase XerD